MTDMQAEKMREVLDPRIRAVGVFVNAPIEDIGRLCDQEIIDLVQIHGDEDGAYLRRLADRVHVPVIRAVRVQSTEQILKAQEEPCGALLLDTYIPGQYGGGGQAFDTALIPPLEKPWFLAGGLQPENVGERLKICRPFGVDVSSGVETEGKKDPEKIRAFIKNVRGS